MPAIIAHRGDSAHAPENTLRAVEQAIARGADWIELDLQRSADGEVFVFHDVELDRLTDQTGAAFERGSAELREIAVLASRFAPATDTCIPTLDEILHAVGDRVPLYLEIKSEGAGVQPHLLESLVDTCLDRLAPGSPHHLGSFHLGVVRRCLDAGHAPILIASDPRRLGELTRAQQEGLFAYSVFHERIDARLAQTCRSRGVPLWAWTVDHERDVERLLDLESVDGICTNDVDALRGWLRAHGERV